MIVPQDVDVNVAKGKLNDKQLVHLSKIAHGCRSVLDSRQKTLDKYGELESRDRTLTKRFKWDPEDFRQFQQRNITLLDPFVRGISS